MHLTNLTINSFRSIYNAKIRVDKLMAIVGQNSAGKTTILRALNSFFNFADERADFETRKHDYSPKSKCRIKLTFYAETPPVSLASFFDQNTLTVSFEYDRAANKAKYKYYKKGQERTFTDISLEWLKREIDFIFIPPVRDHRRLQSAEETLFVRLVHSYLKQKTAKRNTVSPKVSHVLEYFEDKIFSQISAGLSDCFSLSNPPQYSINFKDKNDFSHVLHNYDLKLASGAKKFDIKDHGSGTQSLTIIAMFRYLAELDGRSFIIGIEEPETNLHPQNQREFIYSLLSGANEKLQVMLTTHSTNIIDALEHEQIILCRPVEAKRGMRTEVNQLEPDFFKRNNFDQQQAESFFRYNNSDVYFANRVFVVEGKGDIAALKLAGKQLNINFDLQGFSILGLSGVENFKYPLALLKELNIPFTLIVDKDFFYPYLNVEKEKSRDSNGFFKYGPDMKKGASKLVKALVKDKGERNMVLKKFHASHQRHAKILEKSNIIVMRFNLEMDLIKTEKGRDFLYVKFKIPNDKRTPNTLLIDNKGRIKNHKVIYELVQQLPPQSIPYSLQLIKKHLRRVSST